MNIDATAQSKTEWHNLPAQEVLRELNADHAGLTLDEASRRLQQHGPNRLPAAPRDSLAVRFARQFDNALIYVLLASAAITALLNHWVDCSVIVGVVLINAVIGVIQEGKAERAMDAIRNMLSPTATVLREGRRREIPAEQVVPGDVVLLASGDKVPADLRLIEARQLRVEEAALTGESEAVEKNIAAVNAKTVVADRRCMAYSGTLVVYGQARGVAVATGSATEIGHISSLISAVDRLETPLLRQMTRFGQQLTWAILLLAVLTFLFGVWVRSYGWSEMFFAAVGLAVAAIPEGLPAIMTIVLAFGVQRMARRNAIIRRLPAVEALGSVTVICSDKTGTLTRNEMTVQRIITAGKTFEVSGSGYAPRGGFAIDGREVSVGTYPELLELGRAALLCNDATLHHDDGEWVVEGDPTEGALLTLAAKAGLDLTFEREALPRTDLIPFESQHRFMATLHHDMEGHGFIFLKGAPEQVMEVCVAERADGEDKPLHHAWWQQAMQDAARQGFRLLAVAMRPTADTQRNLDFTDMRGGFALLGVFAIADPPRDEAIRAVAHCKAAGIHVKMITGDHLDTARAIGARFGLSSERVLSGSDIEQMSPDELRRAVTEAEIFARASPEHKLALVQALQANGEVVAMTGDGVNDAPALKRADVGVAMGRKGTEAAKEAAEMVLADDNFASIAAAVEEGRTVYDNLKKSIVFVLPTNGGEAAVIIAAILLGLTLPITPVQILWVNMVTAITLSLALAFEPPESGVMRRPPRSTSEPLLNGFLLWRILFVSLLMVAGSLGFFLWEQARGASIEAARTMAVNALVMGEIFYLFNCRFLLAPSWNWRGFTQSRPVLVSILCVVSLQALFTYAPLFQKMFGTVALDGAAWWRILLFGALLFVIVETEKLLFRRRQRR
ncbi:cation-transporting P-type ATPase [Ferrigenium kumadai]|uniref:Cation-transporting P-type ATPase n=1 Tax=Ferrigenium kumadai TaxID=1682490 RepID=A0AAN1T2B5_9PROT|nr:cation-transporting P-type ATPase [Ferrigenium kumadai]BBJ00605.1 cation-transporting P-type ATPase [Ferrigenium kumadai]